MSYIGATPSQQLVTPAVDYFSGNGVTTTFTLTRAVTSVFSVEVVVNGVQQNPRTAYSINQAGNIVFDGAPSAGANNIYVVYNSQVGQFVTPSPGTVGTAALASISNINSVGSDLTLQITGVNALTINQNRQVGIGTTPSYSLDINARTDAIRLPQGTSATRPTPASGLLRFNSTGIGSLEYYGSTSWTTVAPLADGSSATQAAVNAQSIKNFTGTTTSGYYWINVGGTPTQVWCDMTGATAWMLLMRASSGGTDLSYDSAFWTNGATGLNATGNPLTNISIKNGALWNSSVVTNLRLTGSTNAAAYTANPLTFGVFNTTAQGIFTAGNNAWDAQIGYTRAEWLAWGVAAAGNVVSNFNTQPNCNTTAINNTGSGPYARIRLGWSGNNEADCATNDSWVGIGGFWNELQRNGGAQSWSPSVYTPCSVWLWMN